MNKALTETGLDSEMANRHLARLTAMERIEWAVEVYGSRLYALTSAGLDSALTVAHVAASGHDIPFIHIDTHFLPEETLTNLAVLQSHYPGLSWHSYGPSEKQVRDIFRTRLWETNLAEYRRQTKLAPLSRAIGELGVQALITGIRSDQTAHRANLSFVKPGHDGELRIHPFIDWPTTQVATYFTEHNLPRHSLHDTVDFLDDWPLMNGTKTECGLHL